MSGAYEIYSSLAPAYGKSTLRLIRNPHSRVYLTLLKFAFPDTSRPILDEDLWAAFDQALRELDRAGLRESIPVEDGAIRSGKSLCKELIDNYSWMESTMLADGHVEFRLTSDATEALNVIDRLNSLESVMSESRMRTLVEAIQRAAILFSVDYEQGRQILVQRLEQAQRELDEYEQRGGGELLTEARAKDVVYNLEDLMSQLPYDLRRLEEDVRSNAMELIDSFRGDERPVGEIIAGYLERGEDLVANTEHGRSFLDAVRVIGDPAVSEGVVSRLDAIALAPLGTGKPLPQALLLQRGWNQISVGIAQVNDANTRASRVIGRSIAQHDVERDRELTMALKRLESLVYDWAVCTSRLQLAPFETTIQRWDIGSLRTKFWSSPNTVVPPALESEHADSITLSIEELRRLGGPLTSEVLTAIVQAAPFDAKSVNLASGFNALDADLRRPVELAGLLQFATRIGTELEHVAREEYRCVDANGNPCAWLGPVVNLELGRVEHEVGKVRA